METPPVSLALEALGIPHRIFRHEGSVSSLEQAAADRGQRPSQVVRSILFRISETEFAMVLAAGPDQVSWKALRKLLGRSRISMASEEEVLAVTGYRIGAVGPFGLKQPVRMLIDTGVTAEQEVSIGSGLRGTAVILKSADLVRALGDVQIAALGE